MYISQYAYKKLSDDVVTKLLFSNLEDDGQQGDLIFVVGSSRAVQYRVPKAVALYKQGRANKILFSGGVTWPGLPHTEAALMADAAIKAGVSTEDIFIEEDSKNTLENVLASMLVMNRIKPLHQIKRILIVTTFYHMRRLYITLKTYMPEWIKWSFCAAQDMITDPSNWYLTELGRWRAEEECRKIIYYVQQGALTDMDI